MTKTKLTVVELEDQLAHANHKYKSLQFNYDALAKELVGKRRIIQEICDNAGVEATFSGCSIRRDDFLKIADIDEVYEYLTGDHTSCRFKCGGDYMDQEVEGCNPPSMECDVCGDVL